MLSFDDNKCLKKSKGKDVTTQDLKDIAADKCFKENGWSWKGKCDMSTTNNKALDQLEIKYYKDDKCTKEQKDTARMGGKEKIEYDFFKCMQHPFVVGKYTKLEPKKPLPLAVVLVLVCCCCCCICACIFCSNQKGSDGGEHHEVHHEEHYEEHHEYVEHHSSKSSSSSKKSGSHHSSQKSGSHHSGSRRSGSGSHHSGSRKSGSHHSESD